VATEIWLTNFQKKIQIFFLIISLQLGCGPVVTENLGRSNGDQNLEDTFPPSFFWVATLC
jgi:hypothetical protein